MKSGLTYFGSQPQSTQAVPPPVWRRLFHVVAGSTIPIIGIFVFEAGMVAGLAIVSGSGLILDLIRFRLPWLNRQFLRWLAPLLKQGEGHRLTGATYLAVGGLFSFLLFGSEVAVPALLFLSLGDPAAALVGRQMPGPRVRGKSPGGTVACIGVSVVVVAVLVGTGAIDYHWGLWVGAGIAGLVELASVPPDDNVSIPILAGAAMHFLGV